MKWKLSQIVPHDGEADVGQRMSLTTKAGTLKRRARWLREPSQKHYYIINRDTGQKDCLDQHLCLLTLTLPVLNFKPCSLQFKKRSKIYILRLKKTLSVPELLGISYSSWSEGRG